MKKGFGKPAQGLLEEMGKGLLAWYGFVPGSRACFLGDSGHPVASLLRETGLSVSIPSWDEALDENWCERQRGRYRYVISIAEWEKMAEPSGNLAFWKKLLSADGKLLLGMNNRLGIRYFCGDRDCYTGRNFDGIEGYRRVYGKPGEVLRGRMYSREEMREMLGKAGFPFVRFYSVLPDLDTASLIYAEDFFPNEDLSLRVSPLYHSPETVFLEEEQLYPTLVREGMFHSMANAYLVECSLDGCFSDVLHVTSSLDRGRKDALLTVIRRDGMVEKCAIYPEGEERLREIFDHHEELRQMGVSVVEDSYEGGRYRMPYMDAESGLPCLKRLLRTDREAFLAALDQLRQLMLQSTEHEERGGTTILRRGFWDMVPWNSFFKDGRFVFYDQEFVLEDYPLNGIFMRAIEAVYAGSSSGEQSISMEEVLARYGMLAEREQWSRMQWEILAPLRNMEELSLFYSRRKRKDSTMHANRQRMNCSSKEYQKRFLETFEDIGQRKLVLFGSGRIAKRFLDKYGKDYSVHAILDNDEAKWGGRLGDVEIQSPRMLEKLQIGTYYVLICIKDCMPIMEQLEDMGVFAYCVFEPSREYVRKRHPIVSMGSEAVKPKKFHVGYVAGVFDLFHIGHLNLFKRAKEQCDYLIVGVVTDRQVRDKKRVEPMIPFEERMDIVRSCRYVDEAVEIPFDACETWDAWRMYRFDVQFSGSDYERDPYWMQKKIFLEEHGAAMVFFPYTESTSSTQLKKLIKERLI